MCEERYKLSLTLVLIDDRIETLKPSNSKSKM